MKETTSLPNYAPAFAYVRPEFHPNFAQYIFTGQGTPAFLDYLDRDAQAQQGVELALKISEASIGLSAGAAWERGAGLSMMDDEFWQLAARYLTTQRGK